jgi:hypothetical protein
VVDNIILKKHDKGAPNIVIENVDVDSPSQLNGLSVKSTNMSENGYNSSNEGTQNEKMSD